MEEQVVVVSVLGVRREVLYCLGALVRIQLAVDLAFGCIDYHLGW